jgi:hypothetical protein
MVEAKTRLYPPEQKQIPPKFREMLSNPKFRRALDIAAKHTHATGHETAFTVFSVPESSCWIDEVRSGNTASMENSQELAEMDGYPDYTLPGVHPFFNFHFHPAGDIVAIPSAKDVSYFGTGDLSEMAQYMGVGEIYDGGRISILVMERPKYKVYGHDMVFYDEQSEYIKNYQELQNLLATVGLSSFVVETQI